MYVQEEPGHDTTEVLASVGKQTSLVPRPSLTAFFAAAKKAVREGLGTRLEADSVYYC